MKQQNFLFVDIVSSIFLVVLMIGNFMGLLYITEGNLGVSLLGSIFLVVCYFFVIQLLKTNKEQMIRNKFIHFSLLFWAFFISLGFVSFILISHFINIEYSCKEQIQSEALHKINLVDSVREVYKMRTDTDLQNFEAALKSNLDAFKRDPNDQNMKMKLTSAPYGVDNILLNNISFSNPDAIASGTISVYKVKPQQNLFLIDSIIRLNSQKYSAVFTNWKRLNLSSSYFNLNEYVDENVNLVNAKIKLLPFDTSSVLPIYDRHQLPLNSPIALNKIYRPSFTIPILALCIIHLFLLIPFFTHTIRIYKRNNNNIKNSTAGTPNTIRGTIEI